VNNVYYCNTIYDLISSPKDYVEIIDGIMPIEKGIGLFDGIIGLTHYLLITRPTLA